MSLLLIMDKVTEAMKARRRIKFKYMDRDTLKLVERDAEPYEWKMGSEGLKLYTWDVNVNASRQFFLNKMTDVELSEEFTPRFATGIILPSEQILATLQR